MPGSTKTKKTEGFLNFSTKNEEHIQKTQKNKAGQHKD